MPAAHRHSDSRVCGATTIVEGQSTVKVNGLLWAVDNDPNTDGNGGLIPSGTTVFIEGKLVIVNRPDSAKPDNVCPSLGGPGPAVHCNPATTQGSPDTFCYN